MAEYRSTNKRGLVTREMRERAIVDNYNLFSSSKIRKYDELTDRQKMCFVACKYLEILKPVIVFNYIKRDEQGRRLYSIKGLADSYNIRWETVKKIVCLTD